MFKIKITYLGGSTWEKYFSSEAECDAWVKIQEDTNAYGEGWIVEKIKVNGFFHRLKSGWKR